MKNIIIKGSREREIVLDLYLPQEKASQIIIFSHGFKGFKDWGSFDFIAEYFKKKGIAFLKFNFSFNGTTTEDLLNFSDLEAFGNNNYSTELDDLGLVIDWVAKNLSEKVDTSELCLMGHSRGGGISILKSAEYARVKKVVSWASVADFSKRLPSDTKGLWKERGVAFVYNGRTKQQMPIYYQFKEDYFQNKERLDIPRAAKLIKQKVLIVHGTEDKTVLIEEAEKLKLWIQNADYKIIEGANHTFNSTHPFSHENVPAALLEALEETYSFLSGE